MKTPSKPLSPAIIDSLKKIVGAGYVLSDDDSRKIFGKDETENLLFPPDIVVRPSSSSEISRLLKICNQHRIPITPRGGGTGLSGGALPVARGILLSLDRMNRIVEIDQMNSVAVVEPGVITQHLQEEVEKLGLYYPPDPASRGSSHIGGNLAECAGGPRAVKYGVTKDYVLGLEVVLPTGEIIETGGRVLKNVTGYNLTQLFVGSEGTLGIITKATLRLIPYPQCRKVLLVAFDSIENATTSVAQIFHHGITPSALEFMERDAVKAAEEQLGKTFPNGQAAAQLLIEVDGNHEDSLDRDIAIIAEVVQKHGALDVLLAEEKQKMDDVWALRKCVGEAVKSISPYKEEDTVVPRSTLPQLVSGVKEIAERFGVRSICYGHAGDGNIHVNILKDSMDEERWQANAEPAIREMFELTVSLGGTISGEHGIGYSQRDYLSIALSAVEIELMTKVKSVFDPNGILNPEKIFPLTTI